MRRAHEHQASVNLQSFLKLTKHAGLLPFQRLRELVPDSRKLPVLSAADAAAATPAAPPAKGGKVAAPPPPCELMEAAWAVRRIRYWLTLPPRPFHPAPQPPTKSTRRPSPRHSLLRLVARCFDFRLLRVRAGGAVFEGKRARASSLALAHAPLTRAPAHAQTEIPPEEPEDATDTRVKIHSADMRWPTTDKIKGSRAFVMGANQIEVRAADACDPTQPPAPCPRPYPAPFTSPPLLPVRARESGA